MNKFLKFLCIAFIIGATLYACYGVYHAIVDGNYLSNASAITSFMVILGIIALVYGAYRLGKLVWFLPVLLLALTLQSCTHAKSNQQVLVSSDCGMNWKQINAGESVPNGVGNTCFMRVVIPNFPMQGDSRFIANLKDKVRATTHIDYDYSITNGLAFIKQAKYLGKANADIDNLDQSAFEGAENMVIDKRIKDVAKNIFIDEDIVELDQQALEDKLLAESNKVLEPLGVHLNFITLTFDLDTQTRQSIDISTAMKIYESKGLSELGKQVMVARAGATAISINNTDAPKATAESEEPQE